MKSLTGKRTAKVNTIYATSVIWLLLSMKHLGNTLEEDIKV